MDSGHVSLLKNGVLSPDDQEDAQGKIGVEIRNVVCTYALPLHIDLHRVAVNCGNVTLDQGRSVLLKQKRHPLCYVKIYNSGKVYIVGCRSEEECKRAARGVARMVQKGMGREKQVIRMRNYRICNILATCNMPFGIKIEEMARKYPKNCDYEPELSVGLVWRSSDPKATLRIHTTGSITVTGARSEADVVNAIEGIYPLVQQYQSALRLREAVPENGQRPSSRKRCTSRNHDSVLNDAPKCQHLVIKQDEQDGQELSDMISNDAYFIDKKQEEWTPHSNPKLSKWASDNCLFKSFVIGFSSPTKRFQLVKRIKFALIPAIDGVNRTSLFIVALPKSDEKASADSANAKASADNILYSQSRKSGAEGPATSSTGRSKQSQRRKRIKRNKPPTGFEGWHEEDKQYYNEVTLVLRNWKATRKQCQYRRDHLSIWQTIVDFFKSHIFSDEIYRLELEAYKRSLDLQLVEHDRQLDVNF